MRKVLIARLNGTITEQPNLPNTNRTGVVFGSVRCGAELEQSEQGPIVFGSVLFVRLAISGYCGGIGHISQKYQNYLRLLKTPPEVICTLQLLHVLESTGEPLWFNNGLTEYKWANDDRFIEAEGWVGHDGHWGEGPARFPMEKCIESPPNQGVQNKAVNRPTLEMKKVFKEIVKEARMWDEICENHGLFEVAKGVSTPSVAH